MELSLAGFLSAIAGTAIAVANYVVVVPFVEQRLRALDKSETAAEREEFESKISVMRRLVLGIDIFTFGGLGYWLGARFLGPALGID
ncbi:MAG: hypothetical protein QOF14_2602 [Hyphomicrobiales bacterium]|jgi:hypothetical protein|nr:hypothetical protein [Hyphomicrobiales bacterium]